MIDEARQSRAGGLELWAGPECTLARVGDRIVDQLERTGHADRLRDIDRLAALGVRAVRQPVLWERTWPRSHEHPDWRWADSRVERLGACGIRPIIGLVHHGSGPRGTDLLDPSFAGGLARFARAAAERYPWVRDWTPVNEPLTTARFSALYGHWYPHERSPRAFVRALIVQCSAVRAAMSAIREVNPAARLVQTEDIGTVFSTPRISYQARFENQRRFLSLDLLAGRINCEHPLWHWMVDVGGASPKELESFSVAACPPDVIGINYYVTSDRFLDERLARYPQWAHGGNGREAYADVEAVRVRARGLLGHAALIELVARKYATPIAITEVQLGGAPEEQIRWLAEAWNAALGARKNGIRVEAVTAWAAFGSYDWDSLLVHDRGHYEPGLFDARNGRPRPTALASVAADLAGHGSSDHPLLATDGWWRRPCRLLYPAFGPAVSPRPSRRAPPLLVTGASGTVGRAIASACGERNIEFLALSRHELDITDSGAVSRALSRIRPWAVINAAGYAGVDDAENDADACRRANTLGAVLLAKACKEQRSRYAFFSSDLVFDGRAARCYLERDPVSPLSVYGTCKAAAERQVLAIDPGATVIRTSALFGPSDNRNFVTATLAALGAGAPAVAANDAIVSPTYVPDLAHAVVTLLVDGAQGIWHLASGRAVTWYEFAVDVATRARVSTATLEARATADLGLAAPRPLYSALASERGALMPPLDDALKRYFVDRARPSEAA